MGRVVKSRKYGIAPAPLRFTSGVLRKGEVRYNWGSTPTDYTYFIPEA
jgi:hypothetical protein